MSGDPPASATEYGKDPLAAADTNERETLKLHREVLNVAKRVRRTLLRATRTTLERTVAVDEELVQEHVVVERVPVGRVIDAIPPIRHEGDVTIMPVVAEELVTVRRLVLKEEVHLRRVRTTQRHAETVTLREQQVTVTRTEVTD